MKEIEPREVHERRLAGEQMVLLDVREDEEVQFCSISDSIHIPMNEVPQRLQELKAEDAVVVYCRSGKRSMQVCNFLVARGFGRVMNLRGGINEWSLQVDPSIPRY